MQQTPYFYNGCNLNEKNFVSMYRWHLPDPIYWQKEARITIQQIAWKDGLAETSDDWSTRHVLVRAGPERAAARAARRSRPAPRTSGRNEK